MHKCKPKQGAPSSLPTSRQVFSHLQESRIPRNSVKTNTITLKVPPTSCFFPPPQLSLLTMAPEGCGIFGHLVAAVPAVAPQPPG